MCRRASGLQRNVFFSFMQSVCVCASGSEKALNTRRDRIKVVVLAALEGWVTTQTWRRWSPAVCVCRQRHQLHGSLGASSGGKHSRASLSALAARLPGEGPRQRQHPPRIQQCKRPPSLFAVSPYAALGHSKKRKNTLILYQTQTLMRPSSSGSHCERPQVLALLDLTLCVLCYHALLFMNIHCDCLSSHSSHCPFLCLVLCQCTIYSSATGNLVVKHIA